MKIGIDAREIEQGIRTGIGRWLDNFLFYFSKISQTDECVLFSTKPIDQFCRGYITNVVLPGDFTFYWDQVKLPLAVKKNGIDIFYSPYYKIPLGLSCKSVASILDLMYLYFKPYRRRLGFFVKFYYYSVGRLMARKATRVHTCSIYSKLDILRAYKIHPGKVGIVPLSLNPEYEPQTGEKIQSYLNEKYGIKNRYILYLGNFKPHKNLKNIILSFYELTEAYDDLILVLAGEKKYTFADAHSLIEELHLTRRVIFTGLIDRIADARALYSNAELFLMPSLYEGFGLPPLEAMACGVPVIASNTTSLPEVIDESGLLVDPKDPEDIARAMRSILDDSSLKKRLILAGFENIKRFEGENIAKEFYEYLKEAHCS